MKTYICKCGNEEEVSVHVNVQFKKCRKCKRIGNWLLEEK